MVDSTVDFHPKVIKIIIFSLFAIILYQLEGCDAEQDFIKKLRTDLLTGYEKSVLPTTPNSTLHLQILTERITVDEKTSTFSLKMLLLSWWNDPRIRWDPRQYGDLLKISFPASELWHPELTVYNDAAADRIERLHPVPIRVHWNGDIFWYPPSEFNTSCVHNVKRWPFDSTSCQVQIGAWIYVGLPMKNHPISTYRLKFNPNAEWEVTFANASVKNNIFECCPHYQALVAHFDIRRKWVHPFALVCFPAIAIAMTTVLSFWMDPRSPERTGLLLISLLVNVYYLQFTADIVPPNGDDVPFIIMYFRDSLAMIVIAILWTIISRYIASSTRTSNVPLPSALLAFLESWPSKILCIAPRSWNKPLHQSSGIMSMTESDAGLVGLGSSVYNDWSWLAHLLDRIIAFLYKLTYIIFILAFL